MFDTTFFISSARKIDALIREHGVGHEIVTAAQKKLGEWVDSMETFTEPEFSSYISYDGLDIRKEIRNNITMEQLNKNYADFSCCD